jgi:hypothetical protein
MSGNFTFIEGGTAMKTMVEKYLMVLFIAVCMVITSCGKSSSDKQSQAQNIPKAEELKKPSSSTVKNATADEDKYEEVNPAELSFEMRDYNKMGVVGKGGLQPTGGHIGQFLCEGHPLLLSSDKFEDGFVVTKEYGKIKVAFGNPLHGESFSVYLTAKQKRALSSLKRKKEEQSSSDDEYKPVHYGEIIFAFKDHDYRKGRVDAEGVITPDGGKIGEIHCSLGNSSGQAASSKKIDLLSDKFENGYVNTKQFGKMKVIFRESDGQYIIFLTDKQKSEIIKYLSQ